MINILHLDNLLRKGSLVVYRVLICIYTVWLISIHKNQFPFNYYIYFLIFYCFWFIAPTKISANSWIGLIVDYIYIYFIVYNKNIYNIECAVLLLLPLINLPNLSAKKRYYLFAFSLILIIIFVFNPYSFRISIVLPIFSMLIIAVFENLRSNVFKLYYSLSDIVTKFYELRYSINKEAIVYNRIKAQLNRSNIRWLCSIESIVCLEIAAFGNIVLNGSETVNEFSLNDRVNFHRDSANQEILTNVSIKFNGIDKNENLIMILTQNGLKYAFIIFIKKRFAFFKFGDAILYNNVLAPLFGPLFERLTIFFELEYGFIKSRTYEFKKIKDEYEYVLRTINVVHFIRNRLTPFKNYLVAVSDFNKGNDPEEVQILLKKLLKTQNENAQNALNEILIRAKQILDAENPYNVTYDAEPIQIHVIYSQLRYLCAQIINTSNIENRVTEEYYEKCVNVSNKGLIIVFSDILNNIHKHGGGKQLIRMYIKDGKLNIDFRNSINSAHRAKLNDFIRYMVSDENDNIFKMSSKGAFLIKNFLRQMCVKMEVSLIGEVEMLSVNLIFDI